MVKFNFKKSEKGHYEGNKLLIILIEDDRFWLIFYINFHKIFNLLNIVNRILTLNKIV